MSWLPPFGIVLEGHHPIEFLQTKEPAGLPADSIHYEPWAGSGRENAAGPRSQHMPGVVHFPATEQAFAIQKRRARQGL